MAQIPLPVTKTTIATAPWGIPLTQRVNADETSIATINTNITNLTNRVTALETATAKTAWALLTLSSGWVNYDANRPAEIRKVGDIVYVRGVVRNGTNPGVIFTVPAAYRGPALKDQGWQVNAGGAAGILTLDPSNWSVQIVNGANSYVYLNPVFWALI